MFIYTASNPKDVTVDYVLKANAEEHLQIANFDEKYLMIVTFPSSATGNYEIQVRSTSD